MAKHCVLRETDNFIKNCQNRAGIADFDIDGGAPIVEGAVHATEKELYVLGKATEGVKRVAIAYNPSVKYDVINGKKFPAKSLDDRDYTNPAGSVVDYFFPVVGIEFGITMPAIDGAVAPTVGKFLEPKVGTAKFEIKSTQTAGVPSFEVVATRVEKYPTMTFAEDAETVYIVKTRYNG